MDHLWLQLLRLVHVVGGAIWLGNVTLIAWFLLPTVALEGADGGRLMQRMVTERRLSTWLNVVGGLTILSGLTLYMRATLGTDGAFARSRAGMVLGVGAVAALLAAGVGGAMSGGSARKVGVLRRRIAAEGRAPTAEEGAELGRLAQRGVRGARITAILLTISAAAMALARYS